MANKYNETWTRTVKELGGWLSKRVEYVVESEAVLPGNTTELFV